MTNALKSKFAKAGLGLVAGLGMLLSGASVAGAMTVAEATAFVNALGLTGTVAQAVIAALATSTGSTGTTTTGYQFTKSLTIGASGTDVTELQKFLVAKGHLVMPSGVAYGYFGPLTRSAVAAYQTANNISPAVGYFGPLTMASVNAQNTGGSNPTTPTNPTGPVSVSFSGTPAASTLVTGQATANLGNFNFTGNGVVTNVTLQRIGVSADATLSNVYLFDGAMRLTDAASVTSGGMVTFNNASGLFTVNGSKTVSVKSDIAGSSSGQTVGVKLVSYMTSGSTTATTVNASTNIHTIASATLASASFGTVTPSGSTIDPAPSQVLWQSTLTLGDDVRMKRVAFRQVGSAPANAFQNFKLFVNGAQVATAASLDANGYVTFDLSSSPLMLESGSRIVRMDADVVSGASRSIQFSLRQASDIDLEDASYGVNVSPTGLPATATTELTIAGTSGGSMIVQKNTNVASGDVTADASDVLLGSFNFQAYGEAIKLETIKAAFYSSDTAIDSLRNGRLVINGVQYGSTATLVTCDTVAAGDGDCGDSGEASTGTSFTVNYTVNPGQTAVVEVRADVYDNDGTNSITNGDSITTIIAASTNNAERKDSLGYFSVPNTNAVPGQVMSVKSASATLLASSGYTGQTINIPQTSFKFGSWNLTAGSAENLIVNTVSVDIAAVSGATFTADDLRNVYVKVGNTQSSPRATVSASSNVFSLPSGVVVTKGSSVAVELYADILAGGITTTNSARATATVSGTSEVSGGTVTTGAATGQTFVYNVGSFAVSLDGSSPFNAAVSGNQEVVAGIYKFQATNDAFTVTELDVAVNDATEASAVTMVALYDGSTKVAEQPFSADAESGGSDNMATFTGLNWVVPANTTKLLTVKFMLNQIGTGYGTSQQNVRVQVDRVKYRDSAGTTTDSDTEINGNALYVYKAVPTLSQVALNTSADLLNGAQYDLFKFTVTAPSASVSPNGIAIKQFRLPVTWTDGSGGTDTLEVESLKLLVDGSDVTASDVVLQDQGGASVESTSGLLEADTHLFVSWATGKELVIGAGQTRTITVRGTFQGFNVTDANANPSDSVAFNLIADSAHNGDHVYLNGNTAAATLWGLHSAAAATGSGDFFNFIWSDMSANPHATAENASSSSDWANGYEIYDDMTLVQFHN